MSQQSEFIAKLLLEMVPGPEGQLTQREIVKALNKAYQAGFSEGAISGFTATAKTMEEVLRLLP